MRKLFLTSFLETSAGNLIKPFSSELFTMFVLHRPSLSEELGYVFVFIT